MSWTEREDYKEVAEYQRLVGEYNARVDQYEKLLESYRQAKRAGHADPQLQAYLDAEFEEIHKLYKQVEDLREKAEDTAFA